MSDGSIYARPVDGVYRVDCSAMGTEIVKTTAMKLANVVMLYSYVFGSRLYATLHMANWLNNIRSNLPIYYKAHYFI